MGHENRILPGFPRTHHLPIEPNAQRDDLIVTMEELDFLFTCKDVTIEEKIDGSNCGITVVDSHPMIRNRSHVLNKSYTGNVKTPAKAQFSSVWTWYYRNSGKFQTLKDILGFMPSVYGEWMYAKHTIFYNTLPDPFIAFDLFDYRVEKFIASKIARGALTEAGFTVIPLIAQDVVLTPETLKQLRDADSAFSSEKREGIYIKVSDGDFITHRYKMVRPDFKSDNNWNKKPLVRNIVLR